MGDFGWALVGPGKIAHRFAHAVHELPGARLLAVHGRDAGRAQAFAGRWSSDEQPIAIFTDLDAMLARSDIAAVYIATPHAFHADAIRRCLLAGKAVLCEKSLTPNATLTAEMIALSKQQGVFLMEAVWTRFLPIYSAVGEWLSTGAIGKLRGLQSSFCFNLPFDPTSRAFDPTQAGGALLDIGIYNLSMTQWSLRAALGQMPALDSLDFAGAIGPSGVDHRVTASLNFSGGVVSQFQCAFDGRADNSFRIFGEHGTITVPTDFWQATSATLARFDQEPQTVSRPFHINGFEGEIEEAMRCIARGEIESAVMPHADTLDTVVWMDRMRASLGVRYPFE